MSILIDHPVGHDWRAAVRALEEATTRHVLAKTPCTRRGGRVVADETIDAEALEATAVRMAMVLHDEDWPLLSAERKAFWREVAEGIVRAGMLPHGPERERVLGGLMRRIEEEPRG